MNWKTLLWWLGPWCNQQKAPQSVTGKDCMVPTESGSFRFRVYSCTVQNGAVLVLPGLHPDGLDDERINRFCKVLAGSGAVVGVPELPTMVQSVMIPQLLSDSEAAVQFFTSYLSEVGQDDFGIFCISASSIAGLYLASHTKWSAKIVRLHLFGGFADWMEALRFAMTGRVPNIDPPEQIQVDPLSLPVVYMNLLRSFTEFVSFVPQLQEEMFTTLHDYVSLTWEKPDVIHPTQTRRIADALFEEWKQSSEVNEVDWILVEECFYQACALKLGGVEYVDTFLNQLSEQYRPAQLEWLNVKSYMSKLNVPLDVSHGRDDFVVPHPQALQLVEWSSSRSTRVFVTGLYHHTGVVSVSKLLRMLIGLPKEIQTSIQMVKALSELSKR